MRYIYLHGFASGATSLKATFFQSKLLEHNIELEVIDWNSDDFTTLCISNEINVILPQIQNDDITIIASSMGAIIALNLACRLANVKKIILLAPALQINSLWQHILGEDNFTLWQTQGYLPIYHGAKKETINLNYQFVRDLRQLEDKNFSLPHTKIMIFHGVNDETIPYHVSQEFNHSLPNTQLHLLESNHSLEDSLNYIWLLSQQFLDLN